MFKSSSRAAWARFCCSLRLHILSYAKVNRDSHLVVKLEGALEACSAKRLDVSINDTSVCIVETLGWRCIAALERTGHRSGSNQPTGSSFHRGAASLTGQRVRSAALCNGRQPVDFRYCHVFGDTRLRNLKP